MYTPGYFLIFFKPGAAEGPGIIISMRNLLLDHNTTPLKLAINTAVKHIFISHAKTWCSAENVALSLHSQDPPLNMAQLQALRTPSVDVDHLLWSRKTLKSFLQ